MNNTMTTNPTTAKEWQNWLQNQEQLRCQEYLLRDGKRLISDFRLEDQVTHDYEGREILELLQNAGDAASLIGVAGCVRIYLSELGLIIGNTGSPFSEEGVESLQTAHLSPKRQKKGLNVGEKGLGFRSVLNWTRSPFISSGELRLNFSEEHTRSVLAALMKQSELLKAKVEKERHSPDQVICPLLTFPKFMPTELQKQDATSTIVDQAETLRAEGFDTVVAMPFKSPRAYANASAQLEELPYEVLLFVRSIHQLEIEIVGHAPKVWRRDSIDGGQYSILEDNEVVSSWRLFEFNSEKVPTEELDEPEKENRNFQVTIAVPLDEKPPLTQPLYSFYPTDVEIPLPVLCHATLRLEENRKQFTGGSANRYILHFMARQIAQIAGQLASEEGASPWRALDLLSSSDSYSKQLGDIQFKDALIEEAQGLEIVPCLDGILRKSTDGRKVIGANPDWLPVGVFGDVVCASEESRHNRFLEDLELPDMDRPTFLSRLKQAEISVRQRAALIEGIVTNKLGPDFAHETLMLDHKGVALEEDSKAFLVDDFESSWLPEWASFTFVHQELAGQLKERLKTATVRELQKALKDFGTEEFSTANMLQRLVAAANRKIDHELERGTAVTKELIAWLFDFFNSPRGQESTFPNEAALYLPTLSGARKKTSELYLSSSYGLQGRILEGLYGSWAEEKLVATPADLGFEADTEGLEDFLKWVGVAKSPRTIQLSSHREYLNFLLSNLHYPASFGRGKKNYASETEVENPRISGIESLDGLPDILHKAKPVAIMAWLAREQRYDDWTNPAIRHCKFESRPKYSKDGNLPKCDQSVPCFIPWLVSRTKWLPAFQTSQGVKTFQERPSNTVLANKKIEALFPRPADYPDWEKDYFGLLESLLLSRAWARAGVSQGLDSFDLDQVYELLLSLPERSPDGIAARAVYRWFLENSSHLRGAKGRHFERFCTEGKLWGKKNGAAAYYPTSELLHLDSEVIPKELLEHFKLVDLPARVGGQKVAGLFNVRSLTKSEVQQTIEGFKRAPCADEQARYFDEVKPYLKRLRQSQVSNADKVKALEKLELILCEELHIKLVIDGQEHYRKAEPWNGLVSEEKLYISLDPADLRNPSKDLLAEAIGGEVARIFELSAGDTYARIYQCDPRDRMQLLRRMVGEDLEEIHESSLEDIKNLPIAEPAQKAKGKLPSGEATISEGKDESDHTIKQRDKSEQTSLLDLNDLTVEKKDTQAVKLTNKELIVTTGGHGGSSNSEKTEAIDGEICERLVLTFELQQGRFPIYIENIRGSMGAKCDILSFKTEVDRKAFQEGIEGQTDQRDFKLIERFIEVKGRKSRNAVIELEGNEYSCAREYTDRYYLYRVSPTDGSAFELKVMKDPLAHRDAIDYSAKIRPHAAPDAETFLIKGRASKD